jgi:uncharacterized protein YqeY
MANENKGYKMNTVIEKLKNQSLKLRKERNPVAASITFALSEIEKVGKNNGNRETTNDEAIKVVQKLIATVNENIRFASNSNDESRLAALNFEKQILESALPQMATDEEVREFLSAIFITAPANKGVVMKELKAKFGSLVDMKRAGEIATGMYGV